MNNLLTEIQKSIEKTVMQFGKHPNKIVIGANVYHKLESVRPSVIYLMDKDGDVTRFIYGTPVTIDYNDKDKVYVGYLQEIEVGEIDG